MKKYLGGGVRDPHNLMRDCREHSIKDPRRITTEELRTEIYVCALRLESYAKKAPQLQLRRRFLKEIHRKAVARGDLDRANTILSS